MWSFLNTLFFFFRVFALSYVTKVAFDGIRERLGCCNQSISALKARILVLEEVVKEKDKKISSQDETMSSLSNEVYDLRGRNEWFAEYVDLP